MPDQAAVRIVVSGRVQGVGYRAGCCREARRLGIAGSVRNRADGCVEILAEADATVLESFVEWCRRGTSWAKVSSVEVTAHDCSGLVEFHVK